jgi:hypothetical protein
VSDICQRCGVWMEEHDHEHLARECYPKQIDTLRAQLHAAEERGRRWRRFLLDHLEYCSDPSALELSEDMERELAALRETPATEGAGPGAVTEEAPIGCDTDGCRNPLVWCDSPPPPSPIACDFWCAEHVPEKPAKGWTREPWSDEAAPAGEEGS